MCTINYDNITLPGNLCWPIFRLHGVHPIKGYQGCCFFSSNNSNISFICTKVKLGLYILNLAHKVRKFAEYFFVVTMLLYNKSYSGKPVLFFFLNGAIFISKRHLWVNQQSWECGLHMKNVSNLHCQYQKAYSAFDASFQLLVTQVLTADWRLICSTWELALFFPNFVTFCPVFIL